MLGNFGCADPLPGFMDGVRRLCDEYGIVWILDEVKTGFRIAKGGAQEKYGYQPGVQQTPAPKKRDSAGKWIAVSALVSSLFASALESA